jgi:hypothetical protein
MRWPPQRPLACLDGDRPLASGDARDLSVGPVEVTGCRSGRWLGVGMVELSRCLIAAAALVPL